MFFPRNFDVLSEDVPVIALVQHLLSQGWALRDDEPTAHTATSLKAIAPASVSIDRKHFLRCLVQLQKFLDNGLPDLPSHEVTAYYRLLLEATEPSTVPRGLTAKDLRAWDASRLTEGGNDAETDSSEPVTTILRPTAKAKPAARRREHANARATAAATEESLGRLLGIEEGLGESEAPPIPPQPSGTGAPPTPQAAGSLDAHLGTGATGAEDTAEVVKPPPCEPGMVFAVDNLTVTVQQFSPSALPGGRRGYTRYIVECPLHSTAEHCGCKKHRNAGANQCAKFGPWEPVAFVCVWAQMATDFESKSEHLRAKPQQKDIAQFMKLHGWI